MRKLILGAAMVGLAGACITLTACERVGADAGPHDICVAPKANAPQTLVQVQKDGSLPNATQAAIDSVNADVGLQDCLAQRAYLARRLGGSLDDVSKAVVAQCADKFGASQWAKHQLPDASHDLRERAEDREFDAGEEASSALALVAGYRECAQGVKQP